MTCGEHHDESAGTAAPATTELLPPVAVKQQGLTRLVSEGALSTISESSGKSSPRYVSGCEDEEGKPITLSSTYGKRSESPMRCVSEFDDVTAGSKDVQDGQSSSNPLCSARLRSAHVRALRLEADLQPMRMILGRLMAHPINKKGLFNAPVDATALGLVDYHQIIKKPMDLGTIKARLYSISYPSRQEVAEDICLVFQNSILYNPPRNPVHVAARSLQDYFEELFVAVGGDKKSLSVSVARAPVQNLDSRRVSFTQHVPQKAPGSLGLGKGGKGIMRSVSCDVDTLADQPTTATAAATTAAPMEICTTQPQAVSGASTSSEGLVPAGSPRSPTSRRGTVTSMIPRMEIKQERKRRLSFAGHKRTVQGHSCRSCLGRSCLLCERNCLPLEPTLLVCNGGPCAGARIRKGATYFIASDGTRQYCQRCFTSLPPVLSSTSTSDETIRYKRDLLKRKNDEELVEEWLTCSKCEMGVHRMCALHDSFGHPDDSYVCPGCTVSSSSTNGALENGRSHGEMYTFITGSANPLPLSEATDGSNRLDHHTFSAEALSETDMSAFIEAKVRERIKSCSRVPNAEKTITVRVVSDTERSFKVPSVVRKHFRMATQSGDDVVAPPELVNFKSKAIALFQKVDGLDVCIFCMYVQEYEGKDDYGEDLEEGVVDPKKRVYVAYLDSVEHFRPRSARTALYHELLVSYLASARLRGFQSAHIWACPPSRGNSFVFWNHPASQRTPTKDRLISWYHDALVRAIDCGVVTDVKSLYESDFHKYAHDKSKENQDSDAPLDPSGKMVCPPLLEGDFWIEEAVRIHTESLARHVKAKSSNEGKDIPVVGDPPMLGNERDSCPARQIGTLLLDRIIAHKSAAPFRKPVNAAALKLRDYHKIVTKPMDLGTIYSRCVHGEYVVLGELVEDVELVFSNAKAFNPEGNFVHSQAIEMQELFFKELEGITKNWKNPCTKSKEALPSWTAFSKMSMSLDARLELPSTEVVVVNEKPDEAAVVSTASPNSSNSAASAAVLSTTEEPPSVEELLAGGSDVLSRRMAGKDKWMIEKKAQQAPKRPSVSKKGNGKRRRSSSTVTPPGEEEPSSKRRRQTWLGEEVGVSVRSMRTSFFSCSLVPASSMTENEQEKGQAYSMYTKCYEACQDCPSKSNVSESEIADTRSALLEFSQRRHLEFDTLRHAKYSTAVLLYYLHNPDATGLVPSCTSCAQDTIDCRWHKIVKIEELRKPPCKRKRPGKAAATSSENADDKSKFVPEELCACCYDKHSQKDQFIPVPVSFKSD